MYPCAKWGRGGGMFLTKEISFQDVELNLKNEILDLLMHSHIAMYFFFCDLKSPLNFLNKHNLLANPPTPTHL